MPKHPAKRVPRKHQKRKQVAAEDRPLTAFQRKCVAHFQGSKTQAVIDAGSKSKNPDRVASKLFRLPNVQAALKKKEAAFLEKTGEVQAKRLVLDRSQLDERLLRQLDRHQTHKTRGDQDYYRGIRVGYESLQLIEGAKTITNNTATSAVNNTYEVFKASWKVAREQDMARRADAELTAQAST